MRYHGVVFSPAYINLNKANLNQEANLTGVGSILAKLIKANLPLATTFVIPVSTLEKLVQNDSETALSLIKMYEAAFKSDFVKVFSNQDSFKLALESQVSNIKGDANLINSLLDLHQQYPESQLIIQAQPHPETSGIVVTRKPNHQYQNALHVSANHGVWSSGQTNDIFIVDPRTYNCIAKTVSLKEKILHRSIDSLLTKENVFHKRKEPSLTHEQLRELTELALKVKQQFLDQQELEWFSVGNKFFISHTQPINEEPTNDSTQILLKGQGIGESKVAGVCLVSTSPNTSSPESFILVREKFDYSDLSEIKHAVALICEQPLTDQTVLNFVKQHHLAVVARANQATKKMRGGMRVVVDSEQGLVYQNQIQTDDHSNLTVTKVLSSYGNISSLDSNQKSVSDGLVFHSDFTFLNLDLSPHTMATRQPQKIIDSITKQLELSTTGSSNPFWYRFNSLTNQELGLPSSHGELNPFIGQRGAWMAMHHPTFFDLELEALKKWQQTQPKAINILIPHVRNQSEPILLAEKIKSALGESTPIWAELSTPATLKNVDQFCRPNLSGFFINIRSILSLALGLDPDEEQLWQDLGNQRDLIYSYLLETKHLIKNNLPLVLQLDKYHPQLVTDAIHLGMKAIVVKPQLVETAKRHIKEVEKKIVGHG